MRDKHYKLLIIDIDGTLLDRKGALSAEDKEALARAGASGIGVSLSTGRVAQASLKIIKELALNGYHIFADGALVSNPLKSEEVFAHPISRGLVGQMIEFIHQHEINLELFSATHFFVERETWANEIRRQFFGLEPTIVDFTRIWQKERIIKGTLVFRSTEERAKVASLCRHFKNRLTFSLTKTPAYPEVDFVNVLAADVSKGEALKALVSYLGIALSEVVAIGDGNNDISILSQAGLAIAMGDAPDELKAVASYITLDVDHHGVAAAIDKFLL